MKIKKTAITSLALAAVLSLLAAPAFAGGPLANCQSGVPFLWPNGGANIPFNPDQGALGPLNNADAVALTQQSFDQWGNIASATVSYVNAGSLPVDVDITNFVPFLAPAGPDGLSAIVFDDTGDIFSLLFGPGTGILGFAGAEFTDSTNCTIVEGVSFLNGPSFTNLTAAFDVMVHEFGHYSNLAHTVVNAQMFIGVGDTSGPNPNNTFGGPNPFGETITTMYPFYFGPAVGTRTPHLDDIASISTLYPAPTFSSTTAAISGTIFSPNGTKATGVNVIARNIAAPFLDASSAISSDFTDSSDQGDAVVGTYTIEGLTPGADYAVYVDEILAGGFSTVLFSPLPGPEEFYNGVDESFDSNTDDPSVFTTVSAAAGGTASGIDVLFNTFNPGENLPVGDDGAVTLFPPYSFCVCGQSFDSLFVNANGSLSFGAVDGTAAPTVAGFLDGPPRISGLWTDLNPTAGGTVSFSQTANDFIVTWNDVPEFPAAGANTFSINVRNNGGDCTNSGGTPGGGGGVGNSDVVITYGDLSATGGLAGASCGLFATNSLEPEVDLSSFGNKKIKLKNEAAAYELFDAADNDLANTSNRYDLGDGFEDDFESNDSLSEAEDVDLPFNTVDTKNDFSAIDPAAADVDYYEVEDLVAGQTLTAEVLRGQLDSVLGVFDSAGNLVNSPQADDDAGNGLLSRSVVVIPADGDYFVAVSFCCDYDLDGVDPGQGGNLDFGRYILDIAVSGP